MLNTRDLTPGERLILDRRREGMTKAATAEAYGVTLYRYDQWESGTWSEEIPKPSLGRLAEHESCHVQRLRAGVSMADFAKEIGTSAWWVTRMEAGTAPVARLLEYWSGKRTA